jgi:hypothetical protein
MQRTTRSEVALYVWDYFYVSNVPAPGDEKVWSAIERATCRIRESEIYLDAPIAPDARTRNARRVRDAVRDALRNIERLSVKPEQWVIDRLGELEALSDDLIDTLSAAAEETVLH